MQVRLQRPESVLTQVLWSKKWRRPAPKNIITICTEGRHSYILFMMTLCCVWRPFVSQVVRDVMNCIRRKERQVVVCSGESHERNSRSSKCNVMEQMSHLTISTGIPSNENINYTPHLWIPIYWKKLPFFFIISVSLRTQPLRQQKVFTNLAQIFF